MDSLYDIVVSHCNARSTNKPNAYLPMRTSRIHMSLVAENNISSHLLVQSQRDFLTHSMSCFFLCSSCVHLIHVTSGTGRISFHCLHLPHPYASSPGTGTWSWRRDQSIHAAGTRTWNVHENWMRTATRRRRRKALESLYAFSSPLLFST